MNSSDPSADSAAQEHKISLRVALDAEGKPVLPSTVRRSLRAYEHAQITLELGSNALRAASVTGEEIQKIADTQKIGVDVLVYALSGEGMAVTEAELAHKLRSIV